VAREGRSWTDSIGALLLSIVHRIVHSHILEILHNRAHLVRWSLTHSCFWLMEALIMFIFGYIKLFGRQKLLETFQHQSSIVLSPQVDIDGMQSVLGSAAVPRISCREMPFLWIATRFR